MPRLNRLLFKSGSKGQAGFTLIEVLIALTIFAVGLLALAGMQVTGIRGNATSHQLTAQIAVTDGFLEEYLARPSSDPIFSGLDLDGELVADEQIDVPGAGMFRARVVLAESNVSSDLVEINVAVSPLQGVRAGTEITKTVMKRRF